MMEKSGFEKRAAPASFFSSRAAEEIKLARDGATIPLFFPYEQRKQSTLPLKAFSNREPLRAMLHDDENRLC
jgi:hypothetical protein